MCDLSDGERGTILGHVKGLEEVMAEIGESTRSVEERSWMDHEGLDRLLVQLAARATEAQGWVQRKAAGMHG
jgi:hypothetical protein